MQIAQKNVSIKVLFLKIFDIKLDLKLFFITIYMSQRIFHF